MKTTNNRVERQERISEYLKVRKITAPTTQDFEDAKRYADLLANP